MPLVEGTVETIRGVMTGLRPPALEEFGLEPALRTHASDVSQRTGLCVELHVEGEVPRLAAAVELALFRIAQEALTNAAKHSGSAAVRIRLAAHGARLRLSVEDDGKGFGERHPARAGRAGGWGLQEMRERAEAHGGSLRIDASPRGTSTVTRVPR